MLRVFRPLTYKNYAIFLSCDFATSVGQFIQEVVFYWLAYEITNSAMALGILGVCEAGPRLVLSAIGGAIVDRYNRMRLLILIQYLTALPIFALIFLYASGSLVFWHMVVFNLLTSVIRSVNPSASQSLIRELVPTSVLLSAVALFSMEFNLARVIGPSIGGVLLVWISPNNCFLIYAVTLLISGLVMMRIKLPVEPAERKPENLVTELKEGFGYIQKAPVILASIAAAYIISIFVGTYNRFLPVFAKEILSVGPQGLGILMAAPGAGAITSLFFLGNSGENWRRDVMLWLSSVATPIFLILFCLSRSFWLSTILLAFVGAGQIAFRTVSRLIIQLEVPHALLGRVISVFLMDQGMRSVGSLVMGAFATFFGADVGLALTSVVSLSLTSAVFYSLLRTKPNTLASS
ncbi:MAG TPA: MFS transporter [Candidatus Binatia bacterium]